jgi:hypothetical protein
MDQSPILTNINDFEKLTNSCIIWRLY